MVAMLSRRFTSGLRMTGLLVPLVLAVSMVVPEPGSLRPGIPEALACSGGPGVSSGNAAPPEPGWSLLKPAQADEPGIGPATAIATDGFLPLQGSYVSMSVEQARASIQLVVTDETGKEIPGRVQAFGAPEQQVFGWTATTALTAGQHLTASLSVPAALDAFAVGGKFPLEVVGAPEALPEPSAVFQGWRDNYDGVGALVPCHADFGSCGSNEIQVYGAYEASGHSVDLFSHMAPKSGVVWEVSIAQSSSDPESTSFPFPPTLVTGSKDSERLIGAVELSLAADQACALVIVKDLRTGAEVRGDVCHAAEPATSINTGGAMLSSCTEPPNPAVRDLWCQARNGFQCDLPVADPTAPAGSAPMPSDPAVGMGQEPSDPTPSNAATSAPTAATSKGCQLGQPGSATSWTAWALSLAALSVAVVRRRRD